MAESPEQLPRILWVGVIFLMGLLCVACLLALAELKTQQNVLPIYYSVSDFTLTNQDGQAASLADLTNHVWVADIIFTRCAGPCPRMTGQMKSIQDRLLPDSDTKLVTLTTDPDYDTPEILKRYGEHYGANFGRWTFLTGTKDEIASAAAASLKLGSTPVAPADQKNGADLFIHTTIFVLVDKHERVRGVFETGGEGVDWQNKIQPALLTDIQRLERER